MNIKDWISPIASIISIATTIVMVTWRTAVISTEINHVKEDLSRMRTELNQRVFRLEDKHLTSSSSLYISKVGLVNTITKL